MAFYHDLEFINKYLNTLPKSTALDFLNIDNNLLRISSECISPSLCHIYNLSLIKGIVPVQWKTAKITPVYKGRGDHKLLGNYRPISIVPTVAKVIEAYIKSKLISFLEINKLLCPTQFAYLNNTSTETALGLLFFINWFTDFFTENLGTEGEIKIKIKYITSILLL